MQKIIPHIWFDNQAEEAAKLYASVFRGSGITIVTRYAKAAEEVSGKPAGSVMTVSFKLAGQEFIALNGGSPFKLNPSISLLVACDTEKETEKVWHLLSEGGRVLMEFGKYPFSDKYGWTEDRFGLSWQVMYMGGRKYGSKITPTLMFVGNASGRAEEAVNYYASVFEDSMIGEVMRYGPDEHPEKHLTVKHMEFKLFGQDFAAMDSAQTHDFTFNEALSFMVICENQTEIDSYWAKLSAVSEAEQCGWLKDRYGLSWQIVPRGLDKLISSSDPAKSELVMEALLKMKKIDIAALEKAR